MPFLVYFVFDDLKIIMLKTFSRLHTLITVFSLIALSILGCSPNVTVPPESTVTIEPTGTQEFIPVAPRNAQETVILSYEEDGYAHLFAYIPGELPITRLTSGSWDDVAPAPSPDGEKSRSHPTAADSGICIFWT